MFSRMIFGARGVIDILLLSAAITGSTLAFSQEQQTPQSQVQAQQTTKESNSQATDKGDSPQGSSQEDKTKKKHKEKALLGSFVAAPLPIVSPALGAGVVPVLGYIFPLSKHDKVSPPSVIGAAGLITDNGSRGFGVGAQLFMKENRFQVQGIFANGNLNTLFGEGFLGGIAGAKLPLSQTGRVFFGEGMVNVVNVVRELFIGDTSC